MRQASQSEVGSVTDYDGLFGAVPSPVAVVSGVDGLCYANAAFEAMSAADQEHVIAAASADDATKGGAAGPRMISGQFWTLSRVADGACLVLGQRAGPTTSATVMLAAMTHEMRTPLNGILGMTGLLADTPLDANQTAYADSIRRSGESLLALVNDILDCAKVSAGKIELKKTRFDLRAAVTGALELLAPKAFEKEIDLACAFSADVPSLVRGDEARLRQVLLNLISNAVKFTDVGGVFIHVRVSEAPCDDTARLNFSVEDTGIGIAPAQLSAIFEEFQQGGGNDLGNQPGTGLGLPIARGLARAMGGDIRVESESGAGSTFTFDVVLDIVADAAPVNTTIRSRNPILAVTRSRIQQRALQHFLQEYEHELHLVTDSLDEARKFLSTHQDTTLICDLAIAAMHGRELVQNTNRALVMVTPSTRGRVGAFERIGFTGYLMKPIWTGSLMRVLEDAPDLARIRPDGSEAPSQSRRPLNVLLAEDNPVNALLAQKVLERDGHVVTVAKDGVEALAKLTEIPFDVLLADIRMPRMDGLALIRSIREESSPFRALPIIALTANSEQIQVDECFAAGADEFLSKPFDAEALMAALARIRDDADTRLKKSA